MVTNQEEAFKTVSRTTTVLPVLNLASHYTRDCLPGRLNRKEEKSLVCTYRHFSTRLYRVRTYGTTLEPSEGEANKEASVLCRGKERAASNRPFRRREADATSVYISLGLSGYQLCCFVAYWLSRSLGKQNLATSAGLLSTSKSRTHAQKAKGDKPYSLQQCSSRRS